MIVMIRTFQTHRIRRQTELTGKLWKFKACDGPKKDIEYKLATPCCWESHPDFAAYRGEGEFTTSFYAGGNIRLEFKGVSHTATVFLDGREIANHYNAYTIFDVLLENVEEKEHVLTIKADNRFSEKSALHIPNDYQSYGGVSRPVVLETLGDIYIKNMHITTKKIKDDEWEVDQKITVVNLSGADKSIKIGTKITESDSHVVSTDESREIFVSAGSFAVEEKALTVKGVKEWSDITPNLYMMEAQIICDGEPVDDLIDRFGFREISIEGKHILLNGKKMRIKGFCRHEDHPQYGCALPYQAMAYDLNQIRDLGANSVRTSHYPNDEIFLDLCDEMGILVWEENHARGLSEENMRNPNFEPQAEEVIKEMIRDHFNHPSIYIWGILNECASETEYGYECYSKQFDLIRSLDPSRPCSFASCKFKTDICFGLPDVCSYNIYPQWYHDAPVEDYLDELYNWIQTDTEGAGKPFMITEVGAGGLYGYRNPEHSKWTEEYQAMALEKQITAILSHPDCIGMYIWQYCDVRVCDEWFYNRPRTMNNKGVVDEFRRRKLCYDVVKRLYTTME